MIFVVCLGCACAGFVAGLFVFKPAGPKGTLATYTVLRRGRPHPTVLRAAGMYAEAGQFFFEDEQGWDVAVMPVKDVTDIKVSARGNAAAGK